MCISTKRRCPVIIVHGRRVYRVGERVAKGRTEIG